MLKVKLINEKTPLKIKMVAKFPNVVLANLQDKVVNPSVNEQIINADFGYDGLNNVTINPVTKDIDSDIKPENIKNGIDILGVTGSLEEPKEEEEKSVALDMLSGNQIIMPTENKVLSKVTIEKPSTLISDNIKNGVNIGGVTGNFIGSKYAPRAISFRDYTGTELDYELANLDTSNIANMSYMFYGCTNIANLDLSNFDTNNCNLMTGLFYNCKNIKNLDLSNFDTSKATRLDYMFYYCEKLTSLDLSNFDTSNCTLMYDMFERCSNLKTLDLSNFNTSKVERMNTMFSWCSSLTSLDLSNFDISNCTTIASMFSNCANLETIKINSFNTSKVTNLNSTFNNCMKLDTIPQLNGNNINNLSSSFFNCYNLTNFNGITNLGQAYKTTQSANYGNYKLDLSKSTKLTEQSIINILNNLYDIATKGCNTQSVILGSTNLAKLTSTEGQQALAQAQQFGWSIS